MDRTDAKAKAQLADARLDDALDDSFPASDPPSLARAASPTPTAKEKDKAAHKAESEKLDDALDDSFPASDPPAMAQTTGGTTGPRG